MDNKLDEIRQRTEAATDGPWERFDTPDYAEIHVLGGKEAGFLPVALAGEAYNANFIAHAREDIPYLLSEVDRLNKVLPGYAESARVIALYLSKFCDRSLPYSEMIADAARKADAEITTLTARAEAAEAELKKMEANK